jgi:segregation and condensation protein B
MTDSSKMDSSIDWTASLEALLFSASGPVSLSQLASTLEITAEETQSQLEKMQKTYLEGRGIRLQWHGGRVQLTTAPEYGKIIEKFLGLEASSRISRAGLETLAIVAYQQPVTRPQMDSIRGVSSDGVLKSLLSKGLIQEVGRAEGPGRPIMFGTTSDFLQYFGLTSIQDLPLLESFEEAKVVEKKEILKD